MEEINVTQAARNLSELLNRVVYQGASFELTRGGKRIARLVPSGHAKEVKVADLNALFARLLRLDEDDIEVFEQDISDSDAALAPDRDPWA
ncbi:MAG: type II toxin-antitoxin system prevent-host-death family antitoxin [Chromatiaceae bacterium]|jgi:prevent-host-death family protein|nr:type II toxin-antitoxin system prevent-host-death family antitoxin [Chromatiaceae bacterium]